MIIKICGISKPADAEFAILQGADWVGIIQHPGSVRYVQDLLQAKSIALAAKAAGGIAVGVFVNSNAQQILEFCQITGVTHVQLHGAGSRQEHHLLPNTLTRIYVRHVRADGVCVDDQEAGQQHLVTERDYLLFDGLQAGSGQQYVWQSLPVPPGMRYLISGGLHADNVATAIACLHPDGVDVSSGVESAPGVKDQTRIAAFIAGVRA